MYGWAEPQAPPHLLSSSSTPLSVRGGTPRRRCGTLPLPRTTDSEAKQERGPLCLGPEGGLMPAGLAVRRPSAPLIHLPLWLTSAIHQGKRT